MDTTCVEADNIWYILLKLTWCLVAKFLLTKRFISKRKKQNETD